MKRALLLASALVVSVASVACGKHAFNRQDLDVDLARHHIDLRWGRLGEAARYVHPDLRAAFLQDWATRARDVELQDLEIVGVTVSEDGDSADVVVAVTYVERATLQVKSTTATERWQRTDDGWRAVRPMEIVVAP